MLRLLTCVATLLAGQSAQAQQKPNHETLTSGEYYVTQSWSQEQSFKRPYHVHVPEGKTSWSSRDEKRMMYNRVTQWHTEQAAYLLGRLKSIKNQYGSLLDQTMVVYGSSLSDGHEHAEKNLPVLLAGSKSTITQGRRLGDRKDTSMSDLHLAMLQHLAYP